MYFYSMKTKVHTLKPETMKAMTFFTAAVLFSFMLVSCQKDDILPQKASVNGGMIKSNSGLPAEDMRNSRFSTAPYVIYHVDITVSDGSGLCYTYLVEMTDYDGKLIAEPQVYTPGVTTYIFHEVGPVPGIRVARLAIAPNGEPMPCNKNLYANPDIMIMDKTFQVGETYYFNLFARIEQLKAPK